MLLLTRKPGESVCLSDDIRLTVLKVNHRRVIVRIEDRGCRTREPALRLGQLLYFAIAGGVYVGVLLLDHGEVIFGIRGEKSIPVIREHQPKTKHVH